MKLLTLDLENIGPFDEAHLDFRASPEDEPPEVVPVTFVTGENGTGKSIVIDAIRAVFGPEYATLARPIHRDGVPFELQATLHDGRRPYQARGKQAQGTSIVSGYSGRFDRLPDQVRKVATPPAPRWVVDYWQSTLGTDSFEIHGLTSPDHRAFLVNALQGQTRNAATTELICQIDYLRDSRDPEEKRHGELLYRALEAIVAASMVDGRFSHVARARLEPMFEQRGRLLGIQKLSAGSLYMIQRMLGLMGRMYSCHLVSGRQGDSILDIPGLLLIDEAENHLHPKWQKRLIPTIRQVFPNMQLVVATHSPFILASVPGARVFVCRAERDHCTVTDVSDAYANQPVDEILLSPAFAETQPFSQEITDLLEQRKDAIERGDEGKKERIEQELIQRNREYFDYFRVDELLRDVAGGGPA